MATQFAPAIELTPHDPPMLFVDEILDWEDEFIRTRSVVRPDNPLFVPGRGLPAYAGVEYMAQSISVHDGWRLRLLGEPPHLGFLLGTRKYDAIRDWFGEGEALYTDVRVLMNDGEFRSFECVIRDFRGTTLAQAALNVFRPDDPVAFLAKSAEPI